jgi:hypothetical protein
MIASTQCVSLHMHCCHCLDPIPWRRQSTAGLRPRAGSGLQRRPAGLHAQGRGQRGGDTWPGISQQATQWKNNSYACKFAAPPASHPTTSSPCAGLRGPQGLGEEQLQAGGLCAPHPTGPRGQRQGRCAAPGGLAMALLGCPAVPRLWQHNPVTVPTLSSAPIGLSQNCTTCRSCPATPPSLQSCCTPAASSASPCAAR